MYLDVTSRSKWVGDSQWGTWLMYTWQGIWSPKPLSVITTLNRNWMESKIICCSAHFFTRLVTKLVVSQAFSCSLSLARFGSLWLFPAHSGSLWPTLAVSGAHGLTKSLLGLLRRGCVATVAFITFSFRTFKTNLATSWITSTKLWKDCISGGGRAVTASFTFFFSLAISFTMFWSIPLPFVNLLFHIAWLSLNFKL